MKLYNEYLNRFKESYLMMVPLTIILQSCIGSLAAMKILMNIDRQGALIQLSLCVCVSMMYNAAILAQMKIKIVFILLLLSLFFNSLLLVLNII